MNGASHDGKLSDKVCELADGPASFKSVAWKHLPRSRNEKEKRWKTDKKKIWRICCELTSHLQQSFVHFVKLKLHLLFKKCQMHIFQVFLFFFQTVDSCTVTLLQSYLKVLRFTEECSAQAQPLIPLASTFETTFISGWWNISNGTFMYWRGFFTQCCNLANVMFYSKTLNKWAPYSNGVCFGKGRGGETKVMPRFLKNPKM